jgi:hypothetical protein
MAQNATDRADAAVAALLARRRERGEKRSGCLTAIPLVERLAGEGSPAGVLASSALALAVGLAPPEDGTTTVLLERVIQDIFRIGLLLRAPAAKDEVLANTQSALEQLDSTLTYIQGTVMSWTGTAPVGEHRTPSVDLQSAITHLTTAADTLTRLADSDAAQCACPTWSAADDAAHCGYRALVTLIDANSPKDH